MQRFGRSGSALQDSWIGGFGAYRALGFRSSRSTISELRIWDAGKCCVLGFRVLAIEFREVSYDARFRGLQKRA